MSTAIAPTLGKVIRLARVDAGYTQAQLAKIIGSKQSTVSMWESGRQRPRLGQIGPLARALNIDSSALLAAAEGESGEE